MTVGGVELDPGIGGDVVLVDSIGSAVAQVVKPAYGAEGTATLVDATHGLPVVDAAVEAGVGAPADAAASSDAGTFSLVALVKRLLGKLPASLGAKTSAASLSVVLASDQAALPPTIRAGSSTAATAIVTAANGVAANADRRSLMVVNPRTNTATVWVSCWGAATTAPPSLPVEPGQRLVADGTSVPSGAVSIIAASGSQPVTIVEG
mgnify:CR=1 FL=1